MIHLGLELGICLANVINGVTGRHVVLFPPLTQALLVFIQLNDVLDRAGQNRALVLVTVGDNARNFIDSLIDCLTTTAFNWKERNQPTGFFRDG